MRFLYIKLVGYIGIYNGLGLHEIEIDFSKCKNKITVISGANGCGKSTLLNALSIMPDSIDNFNPNFEASKCLKILDNDTIYDISIIHPLDKNNNRLSPKISILKNGIELNPNGNVSSYKEIIFDEFDLDSNFITLSYLSGIDRGLADKKPGDRKKFIASISNSLEVYNNINKNLSKKSNIYKSHINTLNSKIYNIGNSESLKSTLDSLNMREMKLSSLIDVKKAQIIEFKTILAMNDPDGTKQKEYEDINISLLKLKEDKNKEYQNLINFHNKNFKDLELSEENIQSMIDSDNIKLSGYKQLVNDSKAQSLSIRTQIQTYKSNIDKDNLYINKLSSEINPKLDLELKKNSESLKIFEDEFKQLGISNIDYISVDELKQIARILDDTIKGIDLIYESINESSIDKFIESVKYNPNIYETIDQLTTEITELNNQISNLSIEKAKLDSDIEIVKDLDKRPKNCKIDNCPFLSNSLTVLNKYKGKILTLTERNTEIEKEIQNIKLTINEKEKEVLLLKNYLPNRLILDKITNSIIANIDLLKKTSISIGITDIDAFYDKLLIGHRFNEIRDLTPIFNAANDIIQYKSLKNVNTNLQAEKSVNETNIKTLKGYTDDRDKNEELINEARSNLSKFEADIEFNNNIINNLEDTINKLNDLKTRYNNYNEIENKYEILLNKFNELVSQFETSSEILIKISDAEKELQKYENEKLPISQQKKIIESQLLLLDEYQKEYSDYSNKFDIINKLKKYSSPAAGGIQTLFINLYMSKTLELSNQLLGMIFQGQYRLLDYVINEKEFRIPFVGNGMIVDDITSGSTSQICMIGMIINLVLLNQASTKYNITRLDEIDAGLDGQNRYLFVDVLQKMISILNIDQLFLISHSVESALSNVDVIQLAPIHEFGNEFTGANLIYEYK